MTNQDQTARPVVGEPSDIDDLETVGKEDWRHSKHRHYPTREDWPQAHTKREDSTIEQARCKPLDWLLGVRP